MFAGFVASSLIRAQALDVGPVLWDHNLQMLESDNHGEIAHLTTMVMGLHSVDYNDCN